jgi:hypothetical protein
MERLAVDSSAGDTLGGRNSLLTDVWRATHGLETCRWNVWRAWIVADERSARRVELLMVGW